MAENSDYENQQAENESSAAYVFLACVVLWPIQSFIYFSYLEDLIPFWALIIFNLVTPFVAGSQFKKWVARNQPPK